jgi:hypothetical protein
VCSALIREIKTCLDHTHLCKVNSSSGRRVHIRGSIHVFYINAVSFSQFALQARMRACMHARERSYFHPCSLSNTLMCMYSFALMDAYTTRRNNTHTHTHTYTEHIHVHIPHDLCINFFEILQHHSYVCIQDIHYAQTHYHVSIGAWSLSCLCIICKAVHMYVCMYLYTNALRHKIRSWDDTCLYIISSLCMHKHTSPQDPSVSGVLF